MIIHSYRQVEEWRQARGVCVVIDVMRAFTTAAFAFARGAETITFVGSAEEAFCLYRKDPSLILMGEQDAVPIPGFHYGNSPMTINSIDLTGRHVVQRTTAGTQGVINCVHSDRMFVASFVVANATAQQIAALNPQEVSFIVTGRRNGDEDQALADYLACRLKGEDPDPTAYLERVRCSEEGKQFGDIVGLETRPNDLMLAMHIDRFPFAMRVERNGDAYIGRKVETIPSL